MSANTWREMEQLSKRSREKKMRKNLGLHLKNEKTQHGKMSHDLICFYCSGTEAKRLRHDHKVIPTKHHIKA